MPYGMNRAGTLALAAACCLCALSLHAADPLQAASMKAAVVPGADLLVAVDAAAWRQAPIQEKINAIRAEMSEAGLPPQMREMQDRVEQFRDRLGIKEEDVDSFVFSIQVQQAAEAVRNLSRVDDMLAQFAMVAAVKLNRPLTADAVRDAVTAAAAEEGVEPHFEAGEYKGAVTLTASFAAKPGAQAGLQANLPSELFMALLDKGRLAYIGSPVHVKSAVDRGQANTPSGYSAELAAARQTIMPDAASYALFAVGDKLRGMAADAAAQQQQNPMFGGALKALSGLRTVAFGGIGDTTIKAVLAAEFTTPQEAIQIKTLVETTVLGMAKMAIMQAVGRPIPLMNAMSAAAVDKRFEVSVEMTEEDCRELAKLQTRALRQGGPPMGAPMFPPAP